MSTRRTLVFLLVIVAIVGGLVWVLDQDEGAGSEPGGGNNTAVEIEKADEPLDPTDTAPAQKVVTNPFDPAVEEPVSADEALRIEEPEPDGKTLRVLHKVTGRPVPGALVMFASTTELTSEEKMTRTFVSSKGFGDFLMKKGRLYRCDENGETKVPFDQRVMAIYARKGDLMGILDLQTASNPVLQIKVSEGQHVRIQVEDANGTPVDNVPVVLRLDVGRGREGLDLLKATSDARGTAYLRHIQNPLALMARGGRIKSAKVALGLPMLNAPSVTLDMENLPTEPIVLKLPATRSCEVRVRTPQDEPPPAGTVVLIAHPALWKSKRQPPTGAAVAVCNDEGIAAFSNLPEMEKWMVVAWHEEIPVNIELKSDSSVTMPLPQTLSLTWDPKFPSYRMRVLDHEGNPMPGVKVVVASSQSMRDTQYATLDEESRFTLQIKKWKKSGSEITLETVRTLPHQAGTAELPRIKDGIHEIPDVRLSALPLLASGRVVDPQDQPLNYAQVRAQWMASSNQQQRRLRQHVNYKNIVVMTKSDGSFAIHGRSIPDATLTLYAKHAQFSRTSFEGLRVGTEGVELKLGAVGSVAARLIVPSWCDVKEDLELQLIDGKKTRIDHRLKLETEGDATRATWERIPVGVWNLSIRPKGYFEPTGKRREERHPGLVINNIRIEAGTNSDPRLERIDITQSLRPMNLIISEPDFKDGQQIMVVTKGSFGALSYFGEIKGGKYPMVLPNAAESASIEVDNYQPSTVDLIGTELRVRLEPISMFILEFANIPEATQSLTGQLQAVGGSTERTNGFGFSARKPKAGAPWRTRPQELKPGTYRVILFLAGRPAAGANNAIKTIELPQTIQIDPTTATETVIHIALP